MGNFFPRWTNWLPLKLAIAFGFVVFGISVAIAYYFTPKYTRVGYEPTQPVPFSHKIHAGQLGLDCRYCHSFAEASSHANVPTNQTCFNCHGPGKGNIRSTSPNLELVIKAQETGKSIPWVKVHKAPDYVYFNHSAHLNRGISCQSCHGQINEMEVVRHDQPQSMGWCLDCHRNPENNLRPLEQITNLNYRPEQLDRTSFYNGLLRKGITVEEMAGVIDGKVKNPESMAAQADTAPGAPRGVDPGTKTPTTIAELVDLAMHKFGKQVTQTEVGTQLKKHWQVQPPDNCTACHR